MGKVTQHRSLLLLSLTLKCGEYVFYLFYVCIYYCVFYVYYVCVHVLVLEHEHHV